MYVIIFTITAIICYLLSAASVHPPTDSAMSPWRLPEDLPPIAPSKFINAHTTFVNVHISCLLPPIAPKQLIILCNRQIANKNT